MSERAMLVCVELCVSELVSGTCTYKICTMYVCE